MYDGGIMKLDFKDTIILHLNQGEGEMFISTLLKYEINFDINEIYVIDENNKWERPCWAINKDEVIHLSPTTFLIHRDYIKGIDKLKEYLLERSY